MFPPVNTKDSVAVEAEVQTAYESMFPTAERQFIPRAFGWVVSAFHGQYSDYQAVDLPYHDLEHTLQGTLCLVRLLRTRHLAGTHPQITVRQFQLALLAILQHDTGYLKRRGDLDGTGAKYTVTHVQRGVEFAAALMAEKGFNAEDIRAVQGMIQFTGSELEQSFQPAQNGVERILGQALGTADILGQMAAEDYVAKLPALYEEFAEGARFSGESTPAVLRFSNAQELLCKTPAFWELTKDRLNKDLGGLYRFLNDPFPFGPNHYMEAAEANVARIRGFLGETAH